MPDVSATLQPPLSRVDYPTVYPWQRRLQRRRNVGHYKLHAVNSFFILFIMSNNQLFVAFFTHSVEWTKSFIVRRQYNSLAAIKSLQFKFLSMNGCSQNFLFLSRRYRQNKYKSTFSSSLDIDCEARFAKTSCHVSIASWTDTRVGYVIPGIKLQAPPGRFAHRATLANRLCTPRKRPRTITGSSQEFGGIWLKLVAREQGGPTGLHVQYLAVRHRTLASVWNWLMVNLYCPCK